jgi:peptidoglycan/xylan/chitin deacetylase (PgdA/CDA1 family)
MRRQKRLISELFLLVLAICWVWAVGATSTVFAQSEIKPSFSNLLPEDYLSKKIGINKTAKHSITKVAGVKTINNAVDIKHIHKPVLPPLKDRPYWPYRKNVDCAVQKCVALTFDDGPSADTGQLLDILKSKNAKATFFVLGLEIVKYPDFMRRMIAEKHEIGNHTFSHKNFHKITTPQVVDEINRTQDLIFSITGYKSHIVRPPGGDYKPEDLPHIPFPIVNWNADSLDWKHRDSNVVNGEILGQIKPGSIVIMHDIYPTSISAVPPIIDALQKQGYTLVTVSELLGWKDPTVPLPNGQIIRSK